MELANIDRPDFDEVIREAKAHAGADPIRVRVQPSIYNREKGHILWPQVAWTTLCASLEEVRQLRKALDMFFEAIHRGGIEQVIEQLRAIKTV